MQLLGQLQVRVGQVSTFTAAQEGPDDLAFLGHLLLFQVEVENFVLRVAAEFSSRKEQLVFLINNYDMMLGVLMVMMLPPHLPT
jgi:hypothetical protein